MPYLFIRILLYPYIDLGGECAMCFLRNLDDLASVLARNPNSDTLFRVGHLVRHEMTVSDVK